MGDFQLRPRRCGRLKPSRPSLENIWPELKTVLPNACLRRPVCVQRKGRRFGRQADFVIESYVDPREPLCDEDPFGDHTAITFEQMVHLIAFLPP